MSDCYWHAALDLVVSSGAVSMWTRSRSGLGAQHWLLPETKNTSRLQGSPQKPSTASEVATLGPISIPGAHLAWQAGYILSRPRHARSTSQSSLPRPFFGTGIALRCHL